MSDTFIIALLIGWIVMQLWLDRLNRQRYNELDRRLEYSELRQLAIERALLDHGIVVPPIPEE